jgi:uncharacterized C2H2 Zn-finger protein
MFSAQQYQQIFKRKSNLSKMMNPVHQLQEAQGKMKTKRNKNKKQANKQTGENESKTETGKQLQQQN